MKFLSDAHSLEWFSAIGISVRDMGDLSFAKEPSHQLLVQPLSLAAPALADFAASVAEWLPSEEKISWFPQGGKIYPDHYAFLECLERGCDNSQPFGATPGMVFEANNQKDSALLPWFIFLRLTWDAWGHIVAKEAGDYLQLHDEYVVFATSRKGAFDAALALAEKYKLPSKVLKQ
jgi:hypothetical protein